MRKHPRVCAYANNQHELGGDLGSDPRNSSFFKALELPTTVGVLVIWLSFCTLGSCDTIFLVFNHIICAQTYAAIDIAGFDGVSLIDVLGERSGSSATISIGI